MTLIEFLTARYEEDEVVAKAAVNFDYGVKDWADDGDPVNMHIARHDPARVLREVEAGRKILAEYERLNAAYLEFRHGANQAALLAIETAVLALAEVYSDHPDYDEAWKP